MPREYGELLAIEGDPMDNSDSVFAPLGNRQSPLLDFAMPRRRMTARAGNHLCAPFD